MNTVTIQQALELGFQHHRAGRLADAETLYRQILAQQPNHAEALHYFGIIAHQAGRLDLAIELLQRALLAHPNDAAVWSNLGEVYRTMGRLDEAIAAYQRALAIHPNFAEAHNNLGIVLMARQQLDAAIASYQRALQLRAAFPEAHNNLGIALARQGRRDEAITSYQRALDLKPDYAEACFNHGIALAGKRCWEDAAAQYRHALALRPRYPEACYNLGIVLRHGGLFEQAEAAYRQALALQPHYVEALNNLGYLLTDAGRFDEAIATLRRALELRPNYASATYNLGVAFQKCGQLEAAIGAYEQARGLDPDHVEAHNNLGIVLAEMGRFDEAIASIQQALLLKPHYAPAYNNLGMALVGTGRYADAVAAYQEAIRFAPEYAEAYNNLGVALDDQGQLDEAAAAFRQALQLKPDYPEAHNNLGNVRCNQGRVADAIASFHRALQLQPGFAMVRSNLIHTLNFLPGDAAPAIEAEQQRRNRQFSDPVKRFALPHPNSRSTERPLRIGYVSPDFRDHVIGRNILPLFRCHDHRQFQVLGYSGVIRPDEFTEEFHRLTDEWRCTVGLTDEALAALIRQDAVDILVDLSQHLSGNRLRVFARHPAPVQVSFAGYPESAGVEAIRYRISDRWLEAGASEIGDRRSEVGRRSGAELRTPISDLRPAEQVCSIDSFWCYDPCGLEVAVSALPAARHGYVTFGSLNKFLKVNAPLLELWARVLGAVRNSRLILLSAPGGHRDETLAVLRRKGIEPDRVEFVAFHPRREYLELHHRLDIVLDPFPYNGHTTSLDALWMGVPVVSLVGSRPVSRAGWSQLSNLGLAELAAFSEDDYVRIATELAGDLPRLSGLRTTLRTRLEASVLMDAKRFTQQIEETYRAIWRQWCAENPA